MSLELTHTEFAKATPESVWHIWSDVSTWSQWDHGVEWCRLKEGHKFELNGEGMLLPKGAPAPVHFRIIECTPTTSFTDEGILELGSIHFFHQVIAYREGVNITHALKYFPGNLKAKEIFEAQIFPKLQKGLPESVKALAQLAEQQSLRMISL